MRHMMLALTIVLAASTLCATPAVAAVPHRLAWQGVALDSTGFPVPDGPYTFTFRIFDVPTGGSPLWSEIRPVASENGVINLTLGTIVPIPDSVFEDTLRYLEITFENDPPYVPRTSIVSVGFAYRVGSVDGASGGTITSPLHVGPGGAGFASDLLTVSANGGNTGISIRTGTGVSDASAVRFYRGATQVGFLSAEDNFILKLFNNFSSSGIAITNDGDVGIGTTTPAAMLHVNGTAGNNTGVWSNLSDRRLKKDIEPIRNALETLEQLEPVSFRWKDSQKDSQFGRVRGLIAQDVEKVIPEWVKTDPDGYRRIEPIGVDALLIGAVKELHAKFQEVEQLKARLNQLERESQASMDRLHSELASLEARLETLLASGEVPPAQLAGAATPLGATEGGGVK